MSASPAFAVVMCGSPGPDPIFQAQSIALTCVNTDDRDAGANENAISLTTTGNNSDINLSNSGDLTTTAATPYGRGIYAATNGIGSDITIKNTGDISSSDHAIMATDDGSSNGESDDTHVLITNSGAIETGAGAGILGRASYGAGNIVEIKNTGTIDTGANLSGIGGSTGIFASVGGDDGLAKITNNGAITTQGLTAAGISAVASYYSGNNSDIVINNGSHGTIVVSSAEAFGIFASAGSVDPFGALPNANNNGTVTITNAASITSGYHGIGAYTYGANGTITLTNSGNVTSATATSLYTRTNRDNADIVIANSGRLTALATNAHGIYAATNGIGSDITIKNTGDISSDGHAIMATDDGTHNGQSDDTHLLITNSGTIQTGAGAGILGRASYGTGNVVEINNTGTINTGANFSGIGGSTGIAALVGGNDGLAKVTNNGAITTVGLTAAGISAVASYYSGNNSDIVINNGSHGTIVVSSAEAFGIFASAGSVDPAGDIPNANDNGTVIIDNAASITSGYHGIGAYTYGANGDITLTNSGRITTTGSSDSNGIVVIANGDGAVVSVTHSGTIDAQGFGIDVETFGLNSVPTLNANGDVYGQVGGILINANDAAMLNIGVDGSVDAANYLAVSSTSGALTINNSGTIIGRVDLSDDGNIVNGLRTGYFRAITDSNFGTGSDAFNNAGTIDASGDLDGGTGNVSFLGLESLNNTGGLITLVDGFAGDKFTTSGDFTGSGTSQIAFDVDFSTPGVADLFTITGDASGNTGVIVNPTAIGTGAPNTAGIALITVIGNTVESDFDLVGGPVNAGFFAYDLFLDGKTHELRSVGLGNAAYELPAGMTGAQDLWQDGFAPWQDHMANARDRHANGGSTDPQGWVEATGGWSQLDPSITFNDPVSGRSETLNLDNSQQMGGLYAGADFTAGEANGGIVSAGAMAGFVHSVLGFDATSDLWKYQGVSLGAYASYFKDGFFVNGSVKADLLQVEISNGQGLVVSDIETGSASVGVRVDAGYRMDTDWGFIEPQVSLQGAQTRIGDVEMYGSSVTFEDGSSGRATAALRVGGTEIDTGSVKLAPSVTLSVWDDFGGSNTANLNVPVAGPLSATNNPGSGLFGGISANLDIIGENGWSGGLQASVRASSDTLGGDVGASLHHSW